MINKKNTFIFFVVLAQFELCLRACAQLSTNVATEKCMYPIIEVFQGWDTQDADYYNFQNGQNFLFHRYDTVNCPEVLPADKDAAGNWGKPTDGLQLSLRFRHREYLLNEPVFAVVIQRNLAASARIIYSCQDEQEFEYALHQETNTVITKYPPRRHVTNSSTDYKLEPNTETLQLINLKEHCDLKQPGKYSLELQRIIRSSDWHQTTNLVSGTATFEIVKEYSPAEIAARNLQAEEWKKIVESKK